MRHVRLQSQVPPAQSIQESLKPKLSQAMHVSPDLSGCSKTAHIDSSDVSVCDAAPVMLQADNNLGTDEIHAARGR